LLLPAPRAQAQPATFGNALSFNGVNQYVNVTNFGAIAPTNEVSVEFWAYAHALDEHAAFTLQPDHFTNRLLAHVSYTNGTTYWDFGNASTAGRLSYPNPSGTVSNWTHYALVASSNANAMRIYRNGVLETNKTGMAPFVRGTYDLRLGGDGGFSAFNGRLDDFRVWNTARTAGEISANYRRTLAGNEPGLLLYYRLDAASGTVATNSATATAPAYHGALVNSPAWTNSGAPFLYFTDGSTNVVDAITVTVANDVNVGSNGPNTTLLITNGGTLAVGAVSGVSSFLGRNVGSSNNLAVVSGTGSRWTNSGELRVGNDGSRNQLVVSNGGTVINAAGFIGVNATANNNVAVVTGTNSLWTNSGSLYVGYFGSGNQLVVSNGGVVANGGDGSLGNQSGANFNTALVTGTGSLWTNSGVLIVGSSGSGNQLTVSNGARVANSGAIVGFNSSASNNVVVVTGTNSVWANSGGLNVGIAGSGNQLVVSNGGVAANGDGLIGVNSGASNNVVVVTGAGARWTNSGTLTVGDAGSGNRLVVSNGGVVTNQSFAIIGSAAGASNDTASVGGGGSEWRIGGSFTVGSGSTGNQLVIRDGGAVFSGGSRVGNLAGADGSSVLVTGAGSQWTASSLRVGSSSSGNSLVLADNGTVATSDLTVGFNTGSLNNRVTVDGGTLRVTNAGGTAVLDIRRGTNVLNAGLIEADNLLLTNGAGFFEFNGGTLITRGATISNGLNFLVGANLVPGGAVQAFTNSLLIPSTTAARPRPTLPSSTFPTPPAPSPKSPSRSPVFRTPFPTKSTSCWSAPADRR